jgi:tetratricopeptide (TPR) repeat protein
MCKQATQARQQTENPGSYQQNQELAEKQVTDKLVLDKTRERLLGGGNCCGTSSFEQSRRDSRTQIVEYHLSARDLRARGEEKRLSGNYTGALQDLNQSLRQEPNNAYAIGTRGQVYQAMGKNSEALADFNRALAINNSLDWVRDARNELVRTEVTLRLRLMEVATDGETYLSVREIVTDGESYIATRETHYIEE